MEVVPGRWFYCWAKDVMGLRQWVIEGRGCLFKKQLKHPTQHLFRGRYLKGGERESNATGSDGSDGVPFNLSRWTFVVATPYWIPNMRAPQTPPCLPLSSICLLAGYPSVWFCSRFLPVKGQFLLTTVAKCLLIGWMDGWMDWWIEWLIML